MSDPTYRIAKDIYLLFVQEGLNVLGRKSNPRKAVHLRNQTVESLEFIQKMIDDNAPASKSRSERQTLKSQLWKEFFIGVAGHGTVEIEKLGVQVTSDNELRFITPDSDETLPVMSRVHGMSMRRNLLRNFGKKPVNEFGKHVAELFGV